MISQLKIGYRISMTLLEVLHMEKTDLRFSDSLRQPHDISDIRLIIFAGNKWVTEVLRGEVISPRLLSENIT